MKQDKKSQKFADFWKDSKAPVTIHLCRAGSKRRKELLVAHVATQCGEAVKIYGSQAALRRMGDALPALAKHAGVPVLVMTQQDAKAPNSFIYHLDEFLAGKKLRRHAQGFSEFDLAGVTGRQAYSFLKSLDEGDAMALLDENGVVGQDQKGSAFVAMPGQVETPSQAMANIMLNMTPEDLSCEGIAVRDIYLYIMAHEFTHAVDGCCVRHPYDLQASLPHLSSVQHQPIYRLVQEISADRGALEFIRHNPDLFQADYDQLYDMLTYSRVLNLFNAGDLKHFTAIPLFMDRYGDAGQADPVVEAIHFYEKGRQVLNKVEDRLLLNGKKSLLEDAEQTGQRVFEWRVPYQQRVHCVANAIAEILQEETYPDGHFEHAIFTFYLKGLVEYAPAVLEQLPAHSVENLGLDIYAARKQGKSTAPANRNPTSSNLFRQSMTPGR